MKLRNLKLILILPSAVYLVGCASIVSGTQQSVSVSTTPEEGATCALSNNKGTWYIPQTPGTVTVHKSYEALNVNCKQGSNIGVQDVKSSTQAMTFGNILVGGVIGAGVDMGDGAAYSYPTLINVALLQSNS